MQKYQDCAVGYKVNGWLGRGSEATVFEATKDGRSGLFALKAFRSDTAATDQEAAIKMHKWLLQQPVRLQFLAPVTDVVDDQVGFTELSGNSVAICIVALGLRSELCATIPVYSLHPPIPCLARCSQLAFIVGLLVMSLCKCELLWLTGGRSLGRCQAECARLHSACLIMRQQHGATLQTAVLAACRSAGANRLLSWRRPYAL